MTEHVSRVLRKGIVVLPKALREKADIKEGELVVMREVARLLKLKGRREEAAKALRARGSSTRWILSAFCRLLWF